MTNDNLIERSDEEQRQSTGIYNSFRDELLKRQLSNTENYDKSILTLSSAGLAISLTFINSIVPLKHASHIWLMKCSWIFFLLSILISLMAYLVSNAAISKQLSIAEDYYINRLQSAFNKKNWLSSLNNWLNVSVGILFSAAIIAVVSFVVLNLNSEGGKMSEKEKNSVGQISNESATIPTMQRVPTNKLFSTNSAQIPKMQAAPGVVSQQQTTTLPTQPQTDKPNKD